MRSRMRPIRAWPIEMFGLGVAPLGSTCSSTSSGTDSISWTNRCRRAISNATVATSHGLVGGRSGCSTRPTWSTKIRVAPRASARPTGMECTSPPSR